MGFLHHSSILRRRSAVHRTLGSVHPPWLLSLWCHNSVCPLLSDSRCSANDVSLFCLTSLNLITNPKNHSAWTVQARNAFRAAGRTASLGRYSYGFTWATVFAFFVATILFCVGGSVGGGDRAYKRSRFGRKQSTRSRGSFAAHDKETELSV